MAAKLRPRVTLPRCVSSTVIHPAEARGRQLQRLVMRQAHALGKFAQPGERNPAEPAEEPNVER